MIATSAPRVLEVLKRVGAINAQGVLTIRLDSNTRDTMIARGATPTEADAIVIALRNPRRRLAEAETMLAPQATAKKGA
jgi:hypothetical protein